MKLDCIRDLIPGTIFFYNKGRMLIHEKRWPSALFPDHPGDLRPRLLLLKVIEAYG
jgi:hypothetical protein